MELEPLSRRSGSDLAGGTAMILTGLTLLTSFAMGSYVIPGHSVVGLQGWPQPIGWIAQILVVETWPTFGTLEIRWVTLTGGAWAMAALAAWMSRRRPVARPVSVLFGGLLLYCAALVSLVALLAATAPVVELGIMWTWQLASLLGWMLAVYWWAGRSPVAAPLRAISLSLALLVAISLLYSLQGSQRYPNWPVGNVLLLTTACLSGVFLLGTWAYARLLQAMQTRRWSDYLAGGALTALLLLVAIALSLSGRRAGVLGLLAGAAFMLVVSLVHSRRAKAGLLILVILAAALGAVTAPRLFRSGRWETVVLRMELYKNTVNLLKQSPLIGVGPGHLGAYLTSAMRPLHAESPRLFHGEVSEHAHSEPLHALAELGVPVGLLYLFLPIGGLAGYVVAYRRMKSEPDRLYVLGMGAALASVLAAETTSVGMRHPGVAALAWALVAVGYVSAARSGAWQGLITRLDRGWVPSRGMVMGERLASTAVPAILCAAACASMAGAYHMTLGLAAWNRNDPLQTDAELERARLPQGADYWMMRQYVLGRANLTLARQATDPAETTFRQKKAIDHLARLVDISPWFKDTPVWFGRALGEADKLVGLCQDLCQPQVDPYDREALLVLASQAKDPAEKIRFLRASLRNDVVIAPLAQMIAAAAADPACQPVLAQWQAEADKALTLADPAQWPDPLALETYRLAVIVHGDRGEVAKAAHAADCAAILCRRLVPDVRRRRLEAVELETYLDQAWFRWLIWPESGRRLQAMLDEQSRDLIYGEAENFGARMTLQFLAILRLRNDKLRDALRDLLIGEGSTGTRQNIDRLLGLTYARLVATFGPAGTSQPTSSAAAASQSEGESVDAAPTARQLTAWLQRGKRLLGEPAWSEALDRFRAHRMDPWWRGVLRIE
jgi:O-antigen ligase